MLRGYAAKYNSPSKPIYGQFIEDIAPGAFKRTLGEAQINVRALFNHRQDNLLGTSRSGTLCVREDDTGLYCEIDPPDTQLGRDVMTLVKRGDIYGMSFAFDTVEDEWRYAKSPGDMTYRTLKDVDLYDVSVVTDPAYENTEVAVRSYQAGLSAVADQLALMSMRLRIAERE